MHHLDELTQRQARALAMGGAEKVAHQHSKGRLTARERIGRLLDDGTFDERGQLAVSDLPAAREKTPADGKIAGMGQIDGRTIFVSADDVTVLAGAGGRIGTRKQYDGLQYALRKGFPAVHLGEAGGARVPDIMGSAGMMSMGYPLYGQIRQRQIPLITAIMGECYGGPGWVAAVSDLIIQVKGAVMAVGSPAILGIATGEKATPEALGGWEQHAYHTGMVDLFAENDEECLWLIRKVLSYLPNNAQELPPVRPCAEPPSAKLEALLALVPEDGKQAYDMHDVLHLLADEGSLLELKPFYDGSLITAWGRLDGHVVGFLANNPLVRAGAMGPGACAKAAAFITLCDSYHIPLVFLHDTPGFLIGQAAEDERMLFKIMNFIEALQQSTVPRVSCILRKSYGMAHCNMVGGNMGAETLLAWPTAEISFVAPEVAVNIVHGRKLTQLTDAAEQEAAHAQLMAELGRASAPWEAAGRNLIDKVIDPRDTRWELIRALRHARGADGQRGRGQRLLANWPRLL